jgi:hypothetical protein
MVIVLLRTNHTFFPLYIEESYFIYFKPSLGKFIVKYFDKNILNYDYVDFKYEKDAQNFAKNYENDDIVDICIKDYLNLSLDVKKNLKSYKTSINFQKKRLIVDPYKIGLHVGYSNYTCNLNLDTYKLNSKNVRVSILYGIIDSIGKYNSTSNTHQIYTRKIKLREYLIYILRSLGLRFSKDDDSITFENIKPNMSLIFWEKRIMLKTCSISQYNRFKKEIIMVLK